MCPTSNEASALPLLPASAAPVSNMHSRSRTSTYSLQKGKSGVAAAHSCSTCAMFDLEFGHEYDSATRRTTLELGKALLQNVPEHELKHLLRNFVIFPLRVTDLTGWAMSGCKFCEFLHEKIGHPTLLSKKDSKRYIAAQWKHPNDPIYFGPFESQVSEDGKLQPGLLVQQTYVFQPLVSSKSRLASTITRRPINPDPGSPVALQMVRKWLLKCARQHDCRPSPRASFMPTRLLRISVNGDLVEVKIEENLRTKESYAALSYCWGGPQRVTTTQANDFQHLTNIDLLSLPKTILDAVKVSLAVGISLLWVDALCIVQDLSNDKTLEIASMASIYSHAALTITASRSSNADEGFLFPRSPPNNCEPDQLFRIKLRAANKAVGAVTLIPMQSFVDDEDVDIVDNEPLDHRAWAYQERFLSHRVLDFGSYRTQFVCKHGIEHQHLPSDGWSSELSFIDHSKTHPLPPALQWDAHVAAYTARNMTISTDRPLAISALAASLSARLGPYTAGLFTSTLPTSLLWTTRGPPRPRPMNYQGPSYSWLAVNGAVSPAPSRAFTPDPALRVVSHKSTLAHPLAPFAAVASAALALRARLVPVKYIHAPGAGARAYFFQRLARGGERKSSGSRTRVAGSGVRLVRSASPFSRSSRRSRGSGESVESVGGAAAERPLAVACVEDSTESGWVPTSSYATVVYLLYVGEDGDGMSGLVVRRVEGGGSPSRLGPGGKKGDSYSRVGVWSSYRLEERDGDRGWDFEEEGDGDRARQFELQRKWILGHDVESVTLV